MAEVIYLAPLCQEHERMWCEHDAPVDCECIDGPHPWIKYVAALRQHTQSDIKHADRAAMESILWVETIIDDQEAIARVFARHRQYGYDQGYYDGRAHSLGQSDVSFRELAAVLYRKSAEFQVGLTVADSYTLAAEAIAFLQEQSK